MNRQLFFLLPATLFLSISLFGQMEKTLYQTFDLGKNTSVELDLYGDYFLEPWAGNTIMAETRIEIYDAPPHVLDFFITEKGRYEILERTQDSVLYLSSQDKTRAGIRYKGVECFEVVKIKLFVPENLTVVDSVHLVLDTPTTEINREDH